MKKDYRNLVGKAKVKEREGVILVARFLSNVFRPHYYPLVGMLALLMCSYLSLLPWSLKFLLIFLVYISTIALPAVGIAIYRHVMGWTPQELRQQHKRMVPYIIYILGYLLCIHAMSSLHMPVFVKALFAICLMVQCTCTVINIWWKISMHSAAAGAFIGALVAYSALFQFNPVWWLCFAILVSGLVNSSRMYLRQHTLWQVLGGTWVGILCGVGGILLV